MIYINAPVDAYIMYILPPDKMPLFVSFAASPRKRTIETSFTPYTHLKDFAFHP